MKKYLIFAICLLTGITIMAQNQSNPNGITIPSDGSTIILGSVASLPTRLPIEVSKPQGITDYIEGLSLSDFDFDKSDWDDFDWDRFSWDDFDLDGFGDDPGNGIQGGSGWNPSNPPIVIILPK